MIELSDTAGLICGYRFRPDGPAEPIKWGGTEPVEYVDGPAWLHFGLADVRAQKWIAACERIPERGREILLDTDSHIRMETVGCGFAGVLGDLRFEFDADPDRLGVMRLYADEHLVVTARLHPLKTLDRLRLEVREGLPVATTMGLVIRFSDDVAETLASVVIEQGDLVDEIEDRMLKDRFLRESDELGQARRLLSRLRRHTDSQRTAMGHLAHHSPAWFRESESTELHRATERLTAVSRDLEAIQERARLLQDEIASRLGNATNRNLYIVSLLTAIFLPITLITGLFGMNVGGLPWLEVPNGFISVIGLMLATVTTSLLLLYWRRFF